MSTLGNSSSPSDHPTAIGHAPRVLILKDPSLSGRRYHVALRNKGFDLNAVTHGSDALRAMLAGEYDLIIIEIPNWNEQEDTTALTVLRKYLCRHDIPVILLVARPDAWPAERCKEYSVARTFYSNVPSPIELVHCAAELMHFTPPSRDAVRAVELNRLLSQEASKQAA